MNGTLQIIVNLRSKSVEYDFETGENRYSNVLRGDTVTAEDLLTEDDAFAGETPEAKLKRCVTSVRDVAKYVGSLDFFSIQRGGQTVSIHPGDISFVTVEAHGDLKNL